MAKTSKGRKAAARAAALLNMTPPLPAPAPAAPPAPQPPAAAPVQPPQPVVLLEPTGLTIDNHLVATWDRGNYDRFQVEVTTNTNHPVYGPVDGDVPSFSIPREQPMWRAIQNFGPGTYFFRVRGIIRGVPGASPWTNAPFEYRPRIRIPQPGQIPVVTQQPQAAPPVLQPAPAQPPTPLAPQPAPVAAIAAQQQANVQSVENIQINGTVVSWDDILVSCGYRVVLKDLSGNILATKQVANNSIDLSTLTIWPRVERCGQATYVVSVITRQKVGRMIEEAQPSEETFYYTPELAVAPQVSQPTPEVVNVRIENYTAKWDDVLTAILFEVRLLDRYGIQLDKATTTDNEFDLSTLAIWSRVKKGQRASFKISIAPVVVIDSKDVVGNPTEIPFNYIPPVAVVQQVTSSPQTTVAPRIPAPAQPVATTVTNQSKSRFWITIVALVLIVSAATWVFYKRPSKAPGVAATPQPPTAPSATNNSTSAPPNVGMGLNLIPLSLDVGLPVSGSTNEIVISRFIKMDDDSVYTLPPKWSSRIEVYAARGDYTAHANTSTHSSPRWEEVKFDGSVGLSNVISYKIRFIGSQKVLPPNGMQVDFILVPPTTKP